MDNLHQSQIRLILIKFKKHKLAVVSVYVLIVFYSTAIFANFFAPNDPHRMNLDYINSPPQIPKFSFVEGLFVYKMVRDVDIVSLKSTYKINRDVKIPLVIFSNYKILSVKRNYALSNNHDVENTGHFDNFYMLGTDGYGRCMFSRIIHASKISLSVGLVSIAIIFIIGVTIGGISGYMGGKVDHVIQRIIEVVNSFPTLPLWMAIGAIVPPYWNSLQVFLMISVVLSLLGWTQLARVTRGKLLALREEDYVTAANLLGGGVFRIIFRHLLPGMTSHIIVVLTLSVPYMILGETTLSFLGLGLRAPSLSWGVLMQDSMNLGTLVDYPWMATPVFAIIIAVLSFNFLGDGLRDAADPYA